jgi:hypothetical protein
VRPIRSRRFKGLSSRGLRIVTFAFRWSCQASSIEIPRAPSFSMARSVTSSSAIASAMREVYLIRMTPLPSPTSSSSRVWR